MNAITLWRPWPWAIFYPSKDKAKDVENRTWSPPKSIIGKQIAIHAGKKYDEENEEDIAVDMGLEHLPAEAKHIGIIGLVTVDRFIRGGRCGIGPASPGGDPVFRSRWYCGPYGWVLTKRVLLPEPILCRGNQGLWDVPQDILDKIRDQLAYLDGCIEVPL